MKADQEEHIDHVQDIEETPPEQTELQPARSEEGEGVSEDFRTFLALFSEEKNIEEKIRKAVAFMKSRLSLSSSPGFRDFWEIRKLCLPLFKESIPSWVRGELWQQYIELSAEARKLKEILDEQSAFAFEQIDLAVQSVAQDIEQHEERISHFPDIAPLSQVPCLAKDKEEYQRIQKELHFLNSLAVKVNALRKEVIRTDMRIRSKNKLFDKLSKCGDWIFPRRKELILHISEAFLRDIDLFFAAHFAPGKLPPTSLHPLREEVKELQTIAKILTLNTQAFTQTRVKLSSCWDLLKEWDKERRKEMLEKKAKLQQLSEQATQKIEQFEALCTAGGDFSSLDKAFKELMQEIRGMNLDRSEVKALYERMDHAKAPHEEKRKQEIEALHAKERQQEDERVAKIAAFRAMLEAFVQSEESSLEVLMERRQELEAQGKELPCNKAEKALLDRLFRKMRDKILEVKGQKLLSLSDGEQEQYTGLKQLLQEKRECRQETKTQMEFYRKALGGSSLDIEKAMGYQELLEMEKETLLKIDQDIEEIEGKIEALEG
ncbi:MAG: hypothetical protein FJZ58_04115 [Chlamydiae bacterium]|nr:hypothetical protein [Chlamydiota bacterium]